jgi:predicted DsbA family dithiol-disulfide isomerase/uncharacterized membrane protein
VDAQHAEPSPQPTVAPPTRRWTHGIVRLAGALLGATGWWISADLIRIGAGERAVNPLLAQHCGGAESDCVSVLRSAYARLGAGAGDAGGPAGPPWAAIGAGYFGFLGLWFLLVGPASRARWLWHLGLLALIGLGLWSSIHLSLVMATILHRSCMGCLAVHAINGGLALLALASFPWRRERPRRPPHPTAPLALATLLAGYLLVQTHMLEAGQRAARAGMQAATRIVNDVDLALFKYKRQAPTPVPLRPDEPLEGPPDAPHTLIVFSDLECPRCAQAHHLVRELLRDYPGRLRVATRHYPLNTACNPSVQMMHPVACAAARAVEAARLLGGDAAADRMRHLIYERRAPLAAAGFERWAADVGLDAGAFRAALDSAATADHVRADVDSYPVGLDRSVPLLLLNDRRVEYWSRRETWDALLRREPATHGPSE